MDLLELIKFKNEYSTLIEKWESTNELSKYLSYIKPKYLRKCYLSHIQPEYLKESDLEEEKNTLFFMIKFNKKIIGAAWLESITQNYAIIGLYISLTSYRGKGIGSRVIEVLIGKAFKEIKLKKLYLIVRERNVNAIKCFKKCSFEITKKYPESYFLDSSYQCMYQMTLINRT